jgi:hypothetical protein
MGNITSNTKCFIDFGATPSAAGGSLFHGRVKSAKVKDDRGVEVVKAMGVKGGAGHRHKEGGGALTLEIYREDKPTVRFRQLKKNRTMFTWTMQDENAGVRERFYGCQVSNVSRDADDDGNHMDTVEIVFTSSEES